MMKTWSFFLSLAAVVACRAQSTGTSGSGATVVEPVWQDPSVKVLGDVAHGPPLIPTVTTGGSATLLPWGPRAFAATGHLFNFSVRCFIGSAVQPSVSTGFAISQGGRIVLIRAVGPSLSRFGITGVLASPKLEVFDAAGNRIAAAVAWSDTSDDTKSELRSAATAVGAFALLDGSQDEVLLMNLSPGVYTCVVSGLNGSSGTALIESYDVPAATLVSM